MREVTLFEKKLKEINDAINLKLSPKAEEHSRRMSVALEFIESEGLLVYGGLALNLILPTASRFYKPSDTPDIDVCALDSRLSATRLADRFLREGYKYTEVVEGVFEGVYRVSVDFRQIIDIKQIRRPLFEKLNAGGSERDFMSHRVKCVPGFYLCMELHKEFSLPNMHIERWRKLFPRLLAYYRNFPLKSHWKRETFKQPLVENHQFVAILKTLRQYFKGDPHPICGLEALKLYVKHDKAIKAVPAVQQVQQHTDMPTLHSEHIVHPGQHAKKKVYFRYPAQSAARPTPSSVSRGGGGGEDVPSLSANVSIGTLQSLFEVVSVDRRKTCANLERLLSDNPACQRHGGVIVVREHIPDTSDIAPHSTISLRRKDGTSQALVVIHDCVDCVSYKMIDDRQVVTVDGCMHLMYSTFLGKYKHFPRDTTKFMLTCLWSLQEHNMESSKEEFKMFELQCYGPIAPSVYDVYKKRWDSKQLAFSYRPSPGLE